MSDNSNRPPSLKQWLLRACFQYGAVFGAVVAVLTAWINAADFGEPRLTFVDSLLLYFYLFFLYAALGAAAGFSGWVLSWTSLALLRRDLSQSLHFTILWFWPVLVILMLPDVAVLSPYAYEYFWHSLPPLAQISIAFAITLMATGLHWLFTRRRNWTTHISKAIYLGLILGGAVTVAGFHLAVANRDLSKHYSGGTEPLANGTARPLVIIGVDGLGKDAVDRHSDDSLPTLKHISQNACVFELDGLYPGLTPKKWPVITTGEASRRTGVHFYYSYKLPGLSTTIQRWPLETLTSLTTLLYVDRFFEIAETLRCEHHLKAKPLWTKAEARGLQAATICWPHSKNCEERSISRIDACPKGDWTFNERIGKIADEAVAAVAAGADLTMVYFSQLDTASHMFCSKSGEQGEIEGILQSIDSAIGRIASALPESGGIVIVSDHGFDYTICTHVLGYPSVAYVWKKSGGLDCSSEQAALSLRSIVPTALELLNSK